MTKRQKSAKPVSRDNRFKKLKSLKCFNEVYQRICAGWGMSEVARFIQDERNEYTDVSRQGLVQQLCEYRKTIPAGDLVKKRFPEVYDQAKEEVEKGIDEIKELEELYRIQMHRIGTDFATEKKIGKLMPSMTSEMREARQTLESLANLKMELGLTNRASKKVNVEVGVEVEGEDAGERALAEQFTSPAVREVLTNPEQRRRVMGTVERFLKLVPESGE